MTKTALPDAKSWDHYWGLKESERFTKISWSKRRIMQVLGPYLKKGGKALDAGCGSGFFSKYFCDEGMDTTALDYADEALAIAERMTQGRCHVIKRDLCVPGIKNDLSDRFDIIFSDGLLEHFTKEEQDRIFANFVSLLAPRGVIVTVVPNRFSPWELIRPVYMPGIEETPFVLSELTALNKRNGLAVLSSGGLNTFPWTYSPDPLLGNYFGMLLYTVATQR